MPPFFPAPLLPSRPYCTQVQPATSQFPQSEWDRLPRLAALCGDRRGSSIQSPTAALNHRSGPEVRGRAQSALADKSVAVHQNATHTSKGSIKMVSVCMRGGICGWMPTTACLHECVHAWHQKVSTPRGTAFTPENRQVVRNGVRVDHAKSCELIQNKCCHTVSSS